jgi:hypothetical protein
LSFKCHSSVMVQMARGNGTLFKVKARIGSGRVGDVTRVGKLSLALMTDHAPVSAAGFGSAVHGQES